jgi:hypothetical protein
MLTLFSAWIGESEVAWRFPLAFQIVFSLIIFAMIMNLPESPRWLIMKGREEEALEVLEYVNDSSREDPAIITEFDDVKQTVIEMSKGSYRSLFQMTDYREFHRVVLAYTNQMFQQISGTSSILPGYSPQIPHLPPTLHALLILFINSPHFLYTDLNLAIRYQSNHILCSNSIRGNWSRPEQLP